MSKPCPKHPETSPDPSSNHPVSTPQPSPNHLHTTVVLLGIQTVTSGSLFFGRCRKIMSRGVRGACAEACTGVRAGSARRRASHRATRRNAGGFPARISCIVSGASFQPYYGDLSVAAFPGPFRGPKTGTKNEHQFRIKAMMRIVRGTFLFLHSWPKRVSKNGPLYGLKK